MLKNAKDAVIQRWRSTPAAERTEDHMVIFATRVAGEYPLEPDAYQTVMAWLRRDMTVYRGFYL